MGVQWLWLAVLAVAAAQVPEEQYYEMPRLFHLDDYDECLVRPGATFCLGSFDLLPRGNDKLYNVIKEITNDRYHFNRTRIHRGLCVTTSCADVPEPSLHRRFERCVNRTITHHGLEARLATLEYCKSGLEDSPIDPLDISFACLTGVILLLNVVGTVYDVMKTGDKRNRIVSAWSLVSNWRRLTANYDNGDPRLSDLNPVQGVKSLTLILVMMAHSSLAFYTTYLHNPRFLEVAARKPLTVFFQNGTVIVQTFIMLSSFLLAYNMLLYAENNPKKRITLKMLPQCLFHRIVRIIPVYMSIVGLAATWWSRASDGVMWSPLVETEREHCRGKWWTHALFINNFVKPDDKCLIQTWFLAVDMQLYAVATVLILLLVHRPQLALKLLPAAFVVAVVANFVVAYLWEYKPMVTLMFPEFLRHQYTGEPSFNSMYITPWSSLPSSLLGLFLAFLHHHLQQIKYKLDQSLCMRVLYRLSVPGMFLWVFCGYWMKEVTSHFAIALYAAIDRPVFIIIIAVAMMGFFNKIDNLWWQFLSWRGWQVLGRMSLSVLMVHWSYTLMQVAVRPHPSYASVYEIGGNWFVTMFMSYLTALPLHLLVELPAQRFLQALFT